MKDSYEIFIKKYINKEDLISFGLKETIYIPEDKAAEKWEEIKSSILNNEQVYVRRYGRKEEKDSIIKLFYKEILNLTNIKNDPTNNSSPSKMLNQLTKYRKNIKKDTLQNEKIQNYQISHVFGRTKNPFLFIAPWNIVYIPKIVDPFTGHESRGELAIEFRKLLQSKTFKKYESLINDYNKLVDKYKFDSKIKRFMEANKNRITNFEQFKNNMLSEFSKITSDDSN